MLLFNDSWFYFTCNKILNIIKGINRTEMDCVAGPKDQAVDVYISKTLLLFSYSRLSYLNREITFLVRSLLFYAGHQGFVSLP